MNAASKTKQCPNCDAEISLSADLTSQRLKCPHCRVSLKLNRRSADNPESEVLTKQSVPAQSFTPSQARPPEQEPPLHSDDDDDEAGLWPTTENEVDTVPSQQAKPSLSPLSIVGTYRLLFFSLWLGPIFLVNFLGAPFIYFTPSDEQAGSVLCSSMCVITFWLAAGFVVSRFLAKLGVILLVRSVTCPGCKEPYPTVSRWGCSCGYNLPAGQECHIVSFRCAVCQGHLSRILCENCESTILVQ